MTCQGAVRIINALLTFSGKLRCGRLLPESQLSSSCRVPSSRSRQQRRSAREAAQSTANFSCTARTRSAVGAVPFRPGKKKRAEMSFQLSLPGYKRHTEADSGQRKRGGEKCQTAPGRLERTRILFTKVGARNDSGTLSIKLGARKNMNTPSSPDPRLSTCERRHPTAINKKVRVCVVKSPCSWLLCLPSSAYLRVSARISGRALSAADMKPLL